MARKGGSATHPNERGTARELSRACDDLASGDETSEEVVNIVVAHIKRLARTAGLEFVLRVGAVIVHHLYAGDTEAWRLRGPRTTSFRRLAQHPDLPLSPAALCRCVAVFELCERLNAPSRWDYLGASHLRLVLGLPEDEQEKVLAVANARRWTVKALEQHVSQRKSYLNTSSGRRPAPPVIKGLKALRRSLENYEGLIEVARPAPLSPREVEQSARLIAQTRVALDRLARSLAEASSAIEGGPPGATPERQR